jgi:hypothetical protein
MAAPLTPAERLEAAELTPGLPLTDAPAAAGRRGLAAIKMHYLAHAVIFGRPMGTKTWRYEAMLADASAVAASPHILLQLVDQLLDDCCIPTARASPPPDLAEVEAAKIAAKASFFARHGERGRAWQSLSPAVVADASLPAIQRAFADLTP